MKSEQQQSEKAQSTNGEQSETPHIKETKKFKLLLDMQDYFTNKRKRNLSESDYNTFSIIDKNDKDRLHFVPIFKKMFQEYEKSQFKEPMNKDVFEIQKKKQRAIACLLGLAIGDALGSCTEFTAFQKDRTTLIKFDFKDIEKNKEIYMRSGASNIWTDDCSMALSLADSLILNNYKHDPKHTRYMFHMWLQHGLNNGGRPYSIGLGGNISISTGQFQSKQQNFTAQGNQFNNGNGSLMRLGPIPITFYENQQMAMKAAEEQSRTTHNGIQAKQCCRLMTLIIVRLINRPNQEDWRSVIEKACQDFKSQSKSVKHLAMSQQQPQSLYDEQAQQFKNFTRFNKKLKDRNWNWKDPNFTYSESRADAMPGYVGSYCMDALAMALHTVWFGQNFHQIVLKNANMGGDCDTVGDIAGQMAGAIYGIDSGMLHLYSQMEDTLSGRFEVFLKGYKLVNHIHIPTK